MDANGSRFFCQKFLEYQTCEFQSQEVINTRLKTLKRQKRLKDIKLNRLDGTNVTRRD